jgi:hypothetical protein
VLPHVLCCPVAVHVSLSAAKVSADLACCCHEL